jgi:hypothetical protein
MTSFAAAPCLRFAETEADVASGSPLATSWSMRHDLHLYTLLLLFCAAAASALDVDYANEQHGIKLRLIAIDGPQALVRIENRSGSEFAVRSPLGLAVSFFRGEERLTYKFQGYLSETVKMPGQLVCIVPNGGNLEVPMADLYFNVAEPGYGRNEPWVAGIKRLPPGTYEAHITTNGGGMSFIGPNLHFEKNFDFPPFTVKTP